MMMFKPQTIEPFPRPTGKIFEMQFYYGVQPRIKLFSRYDILLGKTNTHVAQQDSERRTTDARVSGSTPDMGNL